MSQHVDVAALLARHRENGGWHALARGVTLVENAPPWDVSIPAAPAPIHCIGVTGPPGAGKSTLVGRLISSYTALGLRVGVIAIDPSSPISGGAVLGDRVRMEEYLASEQVFVRSIASRGAHGAVAVSTRNILRLLEASGSFDVVLVETVGAGQAEVAIAKLADTVVFVIVPGLGDAVQAVKAGLLEVADLIVVNMADRPGAAETMRHFRLALGSAVPVLKTIATEGGGVDELREALDRRWKEFEREGTLPKLRREKEVTEATLIAEEWVRRCAENGNAGPSEDLRDGVGRLLEEALKRWRS